MTDPEFADRTYVEPLTPTWVRRVIERERPDALLPTMGGQTALNVAMALGRDGTLQEFGVELIGANARAIPMPEDRADVAAGMQRTAVPTPAGVSADARCGDSDQPRDRRRGGRLQYPVRRQPGRWRHARHRDEPARVALLGARVEGHRVPDRPHRDQARRGLHAGRAAERHHENDSRLVRAGARLRRGEGAALRVRAVSDSGLPAHHPDG